jgi:hypothetical protein
MAERPWVHRREAPRRRATFSKDSKEESPDSQVMRPRSSSARFSIGNPARGNIDLGGFVKPRLNPEYDESAPIEQRVQPYREAGFFRRMFGDNANEANAEFAAAQQDLQFNARAAELAHQMRIKELERGGALDAENLQYRLQTQANIDAINDARRFGQQMQLGDRGHGQAVEMENLRGRTATDASMLKLAMDHAPELAGTLSSYPDDPMARASLAELAGQRAGEDRTLRTRAAEAQIGSYDAQRAVAERDANAVTGPGVINWPSGDAMLQEAEMIDVGGIPMPSGRKIRVPLRAGTARVSDIYNGTNPGVPAPSANPETQTDQPGARDVIRQPQSQARGNILSQMTNMPRLDLRPRTGQAADVPVNDLDSLILNMRRLMNQGY